MAVKSDQFIRIAVNGGRATAIVCKRCRKMFAATDEAGVQLIERTHACGGQKREARGEECARSKVA